jgi:HEPN domain-containing protein
MAHNEKVTYWLDLAKEDIDVAQGLLGLGKLLYAGFMCHLSVEKALKAKIASTGETPLKIHSLIRLADMGGILHSMTDEQKALLTALNPMQIEARYPDYKQQTESSMNNDKCVSLISQAKDMIEWIEKQL